MKPVHLLYSWLNQARRPIILTMVLALHCSLTDLAATGSGGVENPCPEEGSGTDYEYWEDDPKEDPSCEWVLIEVHSVDPDVTAILKDSGDSITIEATPDPDDESFHELTWEKKVDGGNWESMAGETGASVTLNDSTEGVYEYQAKHGDDDTFVSSGEVYVVEAEITAPEATQDGSESDEFEITVSPSSITVDSYEWSYSVPSGAGRAPTGDIFGDKTIENPKVSEAQWFAPTNNPSRDVDGPVCAYEIGCEITVSGTTLTVDGADWDVFVFTDSPSVSPPAMSRNSNELIFTYDEPFDPNENGKYELSITGHNITHSGHSLNKGDMVDSNSFYGKIVEGEDSHEEEHMKQWNGDAPYDTDPYKDLYDFEAFWALFSGESAEFDSRPNRRAGRNAIEEEATEIFDNYVEACDDVRDAGFDCREIDAHTVSNGPVPGPDYMNADLSSTGDYQDCNRSEVVPVSPPQRPE